MKYMIFEISCCIFEKKKEKIFKFSLFQTVIFEIFRFGAKYTPKITKVVKKKTAKIIKLSYYLSHFIKKNPLFNVDIFFGPLTWNCPNTHLHFQTIMYTNLHLLTLINIPNLSLTLNRPH